jgi:hypothetical protein
MKNAQVKLGVILKTSLLCVSLFGVFDELFDVEFETAHAGEAPFIAKDLYLLKAQSRKI